MTILSQVAIPGNAPHVTVCEQHNLWHWQGCNRPHRGAVRTSGQPYLSREEALDAAGRVAACEGLPLAAMVLAVTAAQSAPAPTAPTRAALAPLVAAAISKLHVGARAVKAAELVIAGQVHRLDGDRFQVESSTPGKVYSVSIKHGCPCPDQAPQGWCKHRLAAAFAHKLGAVPQPQDPAVLLSQVLAQAADADAVEVKVYVRSMYSHHINTPQRNLWAGYRIADGPRIDLAGELDITGLNHPFWSALDAAGWRRRTTQRTGSFNMVWTLAPQPVAVANWPQPMEVTACAA